jgi:hypothetical protein
LPVELGASTGLSRQELEAVVEALGFRRDAAEGSAPIYRRAAAPERAVARKRRPRRREESPFAALAALKVGR